MERDPLTATYLEFKARDRPNEVAYFARFPVLPEVSESARRAGKLLTDIGLADGKQESMLLAEESLYKEHLDKNEPIRDWRNFVDEVLRRSGVQ